MEFKLRNRWKPETCLIVFLVVVGHGLVRAQDLTVTGTVTADGEPLPGVSIVVKGTSSGTTSDFDGNYSINAGINDILVFSYLGFTSKEVAVNGQTTVNVTLKEDVSKLDEVVVIGYGTQKKKEVTGAVVKVTRESIDKSTTSDLGTALQGQIAGVNVQASSGQPGATSNILIRGLSSITGNSGPLYVVDGIPQDGDPRLSINEIESIDVLKDAASAAIYGTRGSGGVILITTKRGKAGLMKVSLDSYYGIQKITSGVPLMDFEDDLYQRFIAANHVNGTNFGNAWTPLESNPYQFTNRTDLRPVIEIDNAPIQKYGLNVSGGKEGLNYSINANYFEQDGVLLNTGYERFNVRANTGFTKGKWKITTGLGAYVDKQEYAAWQLLLEGYKYHPFQPMINPDQELIQDAGNSGSNEAINTGNLASKMQQTDVRKGDNFNGNLQAEYDIFESLKLTSRVGGNVTNDTRVRINPLFRVYDNEGELVPLSTRSGVYNFSDRSNSLTWENSLSFNKKFGDHSLKALALYSIEKYQYSSFYGQKFDLVSNDITVLNGATLDPQAGSGTGWGQDRTNSLIGMLGRIQYDYKGKYLLSVSARRDGSSRFSEGNRWGVFPSISTGWNISDERLWNPMRDVVNAFKIRASYGTTGNQNFLDYSNAATIALAKDYVFGREEDDALVLGSIQTAFANANVKWETTEQVNFGFDLGFFDNKLTITGDVYNTEKRDMLFPLLLPPSTGAGQNATVVLNVGDMTNSGVEYAVNYRQSGNFSWSVGATYSENTNRITKMSGANKEAFLQGSTVVDGVPNEDPVSVLKEGYEAGAFFVIKTDGLVRTQEELEEYQKLVPTAKMGDLRYVDALTEDTDNDGVPDAGNGTIDVNDRVYAGSGMPDFEIGLNFSVDYKGFDFSMQWYGTFGNEIINGSKAFAYKYSTHQDLVYQWTPQNPTSNIPANRGRDHDNYRGQTDYWVEDGSYVRLRNATLGYTLPNKISNKIGVNGLRFYVTAQNPLTFTKYTGWDPEVGNNGLSTRGIDKGNYPISSQYGGGIQFSF